MILRVALDTPLRRLFDYLPPALQDSRIVAGGLAVAPEPGMRVVVPFGRQRRVGLVVEVTDTSPLPADRLKRAHELLDAAPVFDARLLALLRWASEYYHHPLGEVVAAALPKLAREGARSVLEIEWWAPTPEGEAALAGGEPRRARRQRSLLERIARDGGVAAETLGEEQPGWRDAARALLARGWIAGGAGGGGANGPAGRRPPRGAARRHGGPVRRCNRRRVDRRHRGHGNRRAAAVGCPAVRRRRGDRRR